MQVAESVSELAGIFKEIQVLVIDQGTILDRIDFNIEMAADKARPRVRHTDRPTDRPIDAAARPASPPFTSLPAGHRRNRRDRQGQPDTEEVARDALHLPAASALRRDGPRARCQKVNGRLSSADAATRVAQHVVVVGIEGRDQASARVSGGGQ